MARVVLSPALAERAGGRAELRVPAATVRELVRALEAHLPGLADELGSRFAVAIDGEIINDPFLEPLDPESEVHFVPRISGG